MAGAAASLECHVHDVREVGDGTMVFGAVQHEAGVAGYVLKAAPVADLVQALRTVRDGGRVVDPALAARAWDAPAGLTEREREVLRLAEDGLPNRDIADHLHLAEGTVRNYLSAAITKLHARNRTEAAANARERGLL